MLILIIFISIIFSIITRAEQICNVPISTALLWAVQLNPSGVCMGGEMLDPQTDTTITIPPAFVSTTSQPIPNLSPTGVLNSATKILTCTISCNTIVKDKCLKDLGITTFGANYLENTVQKTCLPAPPAPSPPGTTQTPLPPAPLPPGTTAENPLPPAPLPPGTTSQNPLPPAPLPPGITSAQTCTNQCTTAGITCTNSIKTICALDTSTGCLKTTSISCTTGCNSAATDCAASQSASCTQTGGFIIPPPPSPMGTTPTSTCCSSNWQCTNWTTCAPSGSQTRICTDTNGCNPPTITKPLEQQACTFTCNNSCTTGQTSCTNGQNKTCTTDANGCLAFGTPTACPTGQSCNQLQTNCITPSITGACSSNSNCVNGSYCSSGTCVSCNNACTQSSSVCSGGQKKSCIADTNNCYSWTNYTACPSGQVCSNDGVNCVTPTQPTASGSTSGSGGGGGGGMHYFYPQKSTTTPASSAKTTTTPVKSTPSVQPIKTPITAPQDTTSAGTGIIPKFTQQEQKEIVEEAKSSGWAWTIGFIVLLIVLGFGVYYAIKFVKEEIEEKKKLKEYVLDSLKKGYSISAITRELIEEGWSQKQIDSAIKSAQNELDQKSKKSEPLIQEKKQSQIKYATAKKEDAKTKEYKYIKNELQKGHSTAAINRELRKSGWNKSEVDNAIKTVKQLINKK